MKNIEETTHCLETEHGDVDITIEWNVDRYACTSPCGDGHATEQWYEAEPLTCLVNDEHAFYFEGSDDDINKMQMNGYTDLPKKVLAEVLAGDFQY
jgi:hypothetical protein